jgi:hypothetical protein
MSTLKLPREQAQDLAWGETDPEDGLTVELNEQVDSRRWVSVHKLVVRDRDGKFWETDYEKGLTEYQDTRPFEDQEEVSFCEVEKVPVTRYEYRVPVSPQA